MGKIGKDKTLIGITAPKRIVELIDARANALGWSRGKFALEILEKWEKEGAKPINRIDETMANEVMANLMQKSGKQQKRAS